MDADLLALRDWLNDLGSRTWRRRPRRRQADIRERKLPLVEKLDTGDYRTRQVADCAISVATKIPTRAPGAGDTHKKGLRSVAPPFGLRHALTRRYRRN